MIKLFQGFKEPKINYIYLAQHLTYPVNLKLDKTRDFFTFRNRICCETQVDDTIFLSELFSLHREATHIMPG